MPVGIQEYWRLPKFSSAESTSASPPSCIKAIFPHQQGRPRNHDRRESDHLEWVLGWLRTQPDSEPLLQKYQSIDLTVYQAVLPYENRLWEMAGLGEELKS